MLRYHGANKAILGDVNEDGRVTVTDVMGTVGHVTGKTELLMPCLADVNGDGRITVTDVMAIVAIIMLD